MKRTLLILVGLAILAAPAIAQISGTAHDLRGTIGGSQICVSCHTPHGASPAVPLWNHSLPSPANTYNVYTGSSTIDATDLVDFQSDDGSISSLCMSCHDGTVALGSLINDPLDLTNTTTTISGIANLGTDLTNDHPVNFTYAPAATADAEIRANPTSLPLFNGKVECGSCHDVHDNTNPPFLIISNAASAVCLDCHIK
jgi:predicted CXXCH cytochrome family protein